MCAGVSGLRLTGLWGFRSGKHVHLEQRKMRFLASFCSTRGHACSWIFGCLAQWMVMPMICCVLLFHSAALTAVLSSGLGLLLGAWAAGSVWADMQRCFWFTCRLNLPHTSVALGLSSVMQAALPLWCFLNTLARFFPKVVLLLITIVINVMAELTKPKKNSRFHWDVTKLHLLISVNYCKK